MFFDHFEFGGFRFSIPDDGQLAVYPAASLKQIVIQAVADVFAALECWDPQTWKSWKESATLSHGHLSDAHFGDVHFTYSTLW